LVLITGTPGLLVGAGPGAEVFPYGWPICAAFFLPVGIAARPEEFLNGIGGALSCDCACLA
jgi:hypothetical protein